MNKVTLSGYIQVSVRDIEKVRDALPEHISKTHKEKGCLVFEVKEIPGEAGKFLVYEEFESSEAFKAHQDRVRESEWGTLTRDAIRDYQINGME